MPIRRPQRPVSPAPSPSAARTAPPADVRSSEARAAELIEQLRGPAEIWSEEWRELAGDLATLRLAPGSPHAAELARLRQRYNVAPLCTDGNALVQYLDSRRDLALRVKSCHYAAKSEPAANISIASAELLEVHTHPTAPPRFLFRVWLAPPAGSRNPTTVVRINVFPGATPTQPPRIEPERQY